MAELVGDDVLLREWATAGTELVLSTSKKSVSKYAVWSTGQ